MKTSLIFLIAFSTSVLFTFAQKSIPVDNDKITVGARYTEVKVTGKGDLLISVANRDVDNIRKNGFVEYEIFGAKGDGKTDDVDAIAAAHLYANHLNLPVKTREGAIYLVGGKKRVVVIKTNTDFGTSQFIIDDRQVENVSLGVFLVSSNKKPVALNGIVSLKKNQSSIEASLPGTSVISVANSKQKRYIRFGPNRNSGAPQTDVFIVDKNGNVDSNTPIIWDFDEITSITALPVDDTILTIKGGKFQTIANAEGASTHYYSRGFIIRRSNVVMDGLEHVLTGEGEFGAPYRGFVVIEESANVTVQNTLLTGHKVYTKIGAAGTSVSMGSYDLHANRSLNISIINCKQTNDINNPGYWGIFASNFCKNFIFDSCTFSRFDAHMGVANATIRNCTLGHQGINAIGEGLLLIENTTIYSRRLVNLRSDYGSTWNGELIIRNCVFEPKANNLSTISLIHGANSGQHNFGYTCYMPYRITIENLRINDAHLSEKYQGPTIFADFNPKMKDEGYVEKFPYVKTKEVVVTNINTTSGRQLRKSDNEYMFRAVEIRSN